MKNHVEKQIITLFLLMKSQWNFKNLEGVKSLCIKQHMLSNLK